MREDMKATYDAKTDTLSIILKADAAVAESDEDKPGVILDYDEKGNLVSPEILDASKRVTEAGRIEFDSRLRALRDAHRDNPAAYRARHRFFGNFECRLRRDLAAVIEGGAWG